MTTRPGASTTRAITPVFKSLNKPLTIWGIDRRYFFLALLVGGGTFNFFGSLLGGVVMFAVLYLAAFFSTRADPEMPRIVLNAARLRSFYDPLKQDTPDGSPR